MLVGAPKGARCRAKHLIVRSNPDTPPGAIRALRLVGAPTPSIGGHGRRGMRAIPWPEDANRGRYAFEHSKCHAIALVGWAKAFARPSTPTTDSRAPCPPTESGRAASLMVGTAHERLCRTEGPCHRLCPPYQTRAGQK